MRKLIYSQLKNPEIASKIEAIIKLFLNIQSQNFADTLKYLSRDKLIQVINAISEIDDQTIDNLFEEYRYGTNPSFCIFIFDRSNMERSDRTQMQSPLKRSIDEINASIIEDLPRVRNLVVDELLELEENPDVIEGNYSFQRRMDFIDENHNPTSAYETLYGFFWINPQLSYVIIQSRDKKILNMLRIAISEGAGIYLVNLVVTKQLKNALPFL
jgi:hypothetical protein